MTAIPGTAPVVAHHEKCAGCGHDFLRMRLASDLKWYCIHCDPEPIRSF